MEKFFTVICLLIIILIPHSISTVDAKIFPSPYQQFRQGIPINEITCRNDYVLIIKSSNGFPVCVKQSSVTRLVSLNWALKPSSELTFEGFKDTYKIGEEIDFTINFRGFAGCDFPHIMIKNANNETVWTSNTLVVLCDPDSGYGYSKWKVGKSGLGTLFLNQTGTYDLIVTLSDATVEKEFAVVP